MLPAFRKLTALDEAWRSIAPGARFDAVERAGPVLADAIRASGTPLAVRTLDVSTFPYPTKYAFAGACSIPVPYVWMFNRAVLVEYLDFEGARRRLLANPTRPEGSKKAPFFRDMLERVPSTLQGALERALSTRAPAVVEQLSAMGVAPESIDFVTFDHLHVQEIWPLLGRNGLYPKAKLLATRTEIEIARALHPLQRYWYVAGGMDGVSDADLISFDEDLLLGEGLALIRTPGHTEGNHTIVFALPDGLVTISENGVAAECYVPLESKIPGLAEYARATGHEVVLNANSKERTLDQYTSMRLERILARGDDGHPFPRHFSSSELTSSPLAPLVKPTFTWKAFDYGALATV